MDERDQGEQDGLITAAWLIIERLANGLYESEADTWEEAYGKAVALLIERMADVSEFEVGVRGIWREAGDCLP